jgi:hypothetical protein
MEAQAMLMIVFVFAMCMVANVVGMQFAGCNGFTSRPSGACQAVMAVINCGFCMVLTVLTYSMIKTV